MNIDGATVLMVGFWFGFSLVFVTIVWVRQITAASRRNSIEGDDTTRSRVPLASRIAMSAFGLVGAFGAAGLMGMLRQSHPEAALTFLVGVILAIWHSYMLYGRFGFWLKKKKPSKPDTDQ